MRLLRLTSPAAHGTDVSRLQAATGRRLANRGYPTPKVDGVYGPETAAAVHRAAYLLGASAATLNQGATIGVQRMILHPGLRTPAQLARAGQRRRRLPVASAAAGAALQWEATKIGVHELGTTNRGADVDQWEREFGILGQPWCGAFQGFALRHHGVPVTARIVFCPYIEADAKDGTNGFARWLGRDDPAVEPGDLALFNFTGGSTPEHVGMLTSIGAVSVSTIDGNTSPTGGGSQANGGCVASKTRPLANVVGFARPRW